jgi:hypothetical protein
MTGEPPEERRTRARSAEETRVTMLIQTILSNPPGALALLERELKEGGEPAAVRSVLELAADVVRRRGLPLAGSVEWIRERLVWRGYRV